MQIRLAIVLCLLATTTVHAQSNSNSNSTDSSSSNSHNTGGLQPYNPRKAVQQALHPHGGNTVGGSGPSYQPTIGGANGQNHDPYKPSASGGLPGRDPYKPSISGASNAEATAIASDDKRPAPVYKPIRDSSVIDDTNPYSSQSPQVSGSANPYSANPYKTDVYGTGH